MVRTLCLGLSDASGFWNTIWICRRWASGRWRARPASGVPSSRIVPLGGVAIPTRQRASVVFPLPLSPTTARHSPSSTSRLTSFRAFAARP